MLSFEGRLNWGSSFLADDIFHSSRGKGWLMKNPRPRFPADVKQKDGSQAVFLHLKSIT
jgi:hypothetical protein